MRVYKLSIIIAAALMCAALTSWKAAATPYVYLSGAPEQVVSEDFENDPQEFTVNVVLGGVTKLAGIELPILYNSSVLTIVDADGDLENGLNGALPDIYEVAYMNDGYEPLDGMVSEGDEDWAPGTYLLRGLNTGTTKSVGDPVVVASITFRVMRTGNAGISIGEEAMGVTASVAYKDTTGDLKVEKPGRGAASVRATNKLLSTGELAGEINIFEPEPKVLKPGTDSVDFRFQVSGNIESISWRLLNEAGVVVKEHTGTVDVAAQAGYPVCSVQWDGFINGNAATDGEYFIQIKSVDGPEAAATSEKGVWIDANGPGVEVTGPDVTVISPDGNKENIPLEFSFTVSEASSVLVDVMNGSVLVMRIFSGDMEAETPYLMRWYGDGAADGNYNVVITAVDEAGNETIKTATPVQVDTAGPVISWPSRPEVPSLVWPETYKTTWSRPLLKFDVYDQGSGPDYESATISVDGGDEENLYEGDGNELVYTPYTPLGKGTHEAEVVCSDAAGNTGTGKWTFEIVEPLNVKVASVTPNPVNPDISGGVGIRLLSNWDVRVKVRIFSEQYITVKNFYTFINVTAGVEKEIWWDGKWSTDGLTHEGVHNYQLSVYTPNGTTSIKVLQGSFMVDKESPVIEVLSVTPESPTYISSASGDGFEMEFQFTDNAAEQAEVEVKAVNAAGETAGRLMWPTQKVEGVPISVKWNGARTNGTGLPSGVYMILAYAGDDAGNVGSNEEDPVYVTVDNTAPEVTMQEPGEGDDTGGGNTDVVLKVSDNSGGVGVDGTGFEVTLDGEDQEWTWNGDTKQLTVNVDLNGNGLELEVAVADLLGNGRTKTFILNADTAGPYVTEIVAPEAWEDGNIYVSGQTGVRVNAVDEPGGSGTAMVELYIDGEETPAVSSPGGDYTDLQWDTTAYADGAHSVRAVAYDAIGNTNEDTEEMIVDNTAPVMGAATTDNDWYLSNAAETLQPDLEITAAVTDDSPIECTFEIWNEDRTQQGAELVYGVDVSGSDTVAGCVVLWDGKDDGGVAAPDGEYFFYLAATDAAGNESGVESGTIVLDSAAPEVLSATPEDGSLNIDVIEFTAEVTDDASGVAEVRFAASREQDAAAKGGVLLYVETEGMYMLDDEHYVDSGDVWDSGAAADYADDGVYALTFEAVDRAGNVTVTDPRELNVLNQPAAVTGVMDWPDPFSPGNADTYYAENKLRFDVVTGSDGVDLSWTLRIRSADGAAGWDDPWKTFTGNVLGETGEFSHEIVIDNPGWDGYDDGTAQVADEGVYEYRIEVVQVVAGEETETIWEGGTITIDTTPPVISQVTETPDDYFSPDGDRITDTVTVQAQVTDDLALPVTTTLIIKCGSLNSECQSRYSPSDPIAEIIMTASEGFRNGTWNGRAMLFDDAVAPDGEYGYEIKAKDAAGNITTHTGTIKKYDPPVITLAEDWIAFSPNGLDAVEKEYASIGWEVDKGINYTLHVCDVVYEGELPGSCTELTSGAMTGSGSNSYDWTGAEAGGIEGSYYIRVSGYSAVPDCTRENLSSPVWVEAVLDVTPPDVQAFFPYENEFTSLNPRIKLNVIEGLSGISDATALDIDSSVYAVQVSLTEDGEYRVWFDVTTPLAVGLHNLEGTVEDKAGNRTAFGTLEFIALEPVSSDFSEPLDEEYSWHVDEDVPINPGNDDPIAEVAVDGSGILQISHAFIAPDESIYETGLGARGIFDVSRKRTVLNAEVKEVSTSKFAGFFLTGYSNIDPDGNLLDSKSARYLAVFAVDFEYYQGQKRVIFYKYAGSANKLNVVAKVSTPIVLESDESVSLEVVIDEGTVSCFLDENQAAEIELPLQAIGAGFFLFSEGEMAGDTETASAELDSLTTNLARPVLQDVTAENVSDPEVRTVIYNEEEYEITVQGTPYQTGMIAYLLNPNSPLTGGYGPDLITDGAVIAGPFIMVEDISTPGLYKSGPQLMDGIYDNSGYEINDMLPVALTASFSDWGWPLTYYEQRSGDSASLLRLVTNAVTGVSLKNLEGPEGYGYILPGERFRVEAQSIPGDWNIEGYLLNADTFSELLIAFMDGVPDENDPENIYEIFDLSVVSGPLTMTKTGEGVYEYSGTLEGITDATGVDATNIFPIARFGPDYNEYMMNLGLDIGEADIRSAVLANAIRPGADDVQAGETVRVVVRGRPGMKFTAMLYNPDGSQTHVPPLIGLPVDMSPDDDDPGIYSAEIPIRWEIDWTGQPASRISGLISYSETFMCENTLSLLVGDRIPPTPPVNAVIASEYDSIPLQDEQVKTTLTWTPPEVSEDGSEIDDLAGYNIYTVSYADSQGEMSLYSGSLDISGTAGDYTMSSAVFSYDGQVYEGTQMGGAGWISYPSMGLIPVEQLSNTGLIASGKDITVCVVSSQLSGIIFTSGEYRGTIFTQGGRQAVEKWLQLMAYYNLASAGTVDACTVAFHAGMNGDFETATDFAADNYRTYTKVNEQVVEGNVYSHGYPYAGETYPYVMTALDSTGNESIISNMASAPMSSRGIAEAQLLNSPDSAGTGYLQEGEEYQLSGKLDNEEIDRIGFALINQNSLEAGIPLENAVVQGPSYIYPDETDWSEISLLATLDSIYDSVGNKADELRAILSIDSAEPEIISADNIFNVGVAPIREVHITNLNRPGKSEIRVGEYMELTVAGRPNQELVGTIINSDTVQDGEYTRISMDKIPLSETPVGSGYYVASVVIPSNRDVNGEISTSIKALVTRTDNSEVRSVLSIETLDLKDIPDLAGELSVSPEWIIPGWNMESHFSITNSGDEYFYGVSISSSVEMISGEREYVASADGVDITSGESANGTLIHPYIFLEPGNYDVNLYVDIEGYSARIGSSSISVIDDALKGSLQLSRREYISGESIQGTYSIENLSGVQLNAVASAFRLIDESGQIISTTASPTFDTIQNAESINGEFNIPSPGGLSDSAGYSIQFVADIEGHDDVIANKSVSLLPEMIHVDGILAPNIIVSNQEPSVNLTIDNMTIASIDNMEVNGIIVDLDYEQGGQIYASLVKTLSLIESRDMETITATFSPVQAVPGSYKTLIYIKDDSESITSNIVELPIQIEACE